VALVGLRRLLGILGMPVEVDIDAAKPDLMVIDEPE
jgi:hypothetical protein